MAMTGKILFQPTPALRVGNLVGRNSRNRVQGNTGPGGENKSHGDHVLPDHPHATVFELFERRGTGFLAEEPR